MKHQFYEANELPKGLFKACIIPRPIAWVSTRSAVGVMNLAPFSYFNAVCDEPPIVMFSTTNAHREGGAKDTLLNVEETGEFVINIVTYALREQMNLTSADLPRAQSEFDYAKVDSCNSNLVAPLRVAQSPIQLECRYIESVQLPTTSENNINRLVLGRVVGLHVDTDILTDDKIDFDKFQPVARLGYNDYAKVTKEIIFKMVRPVI